MSLNLSKLERVVDLNDGGKQARCPACAELGHDRKGEHLRIYADGRFGCCVHPKDREHRKRIFAIAGASEPKAIRVKVVTAKTGAAIQSNVLGRLGRLFETPIRNESSTADEVGTLGTPFSHLRAYARENEISVKKLKEFEEGVPNVPSDEHDFDCEEPVPSVPKVQQPNMLHLLADGTLVIPFSSPERYHWWKGGQSVSETRAELRQRTHDNVTAV